MRNKKEMEEIRDFLDGLVPDDTEIKFTRKEKEKIFSLLASGKKPEEIMSILKYPNWMPVSVQKKFEKRYSASKLPVVKSPEWLPIGVKKIFDERYFGLDALKNNELVKSFLPYQIKVTRLKRIIPAFTRSEMKDVWLKLDKLSPEECTHFAKRLFHIEEDMDTAVRMYARFVGSNECAKSIINKTSELLDLIDKYQVHFSGDDYFGEFGSLKEQLLELSETLKESFLNLGKDIGFLSNELFPVNRETTSKAGMAVFFIRKISTFFRRSYGKPWHSDVATIVNTIFDSEYSDNDIVKITGTNKKNKK